MPTVKPMLVTFFFTFLFAVLVIVFAHFVVLCGSSNSKKKINKKKRRKKIRKVSVYVWCNFDMTKVKWTWRYKCDRQSRTWSIKTNLEIYSFSQFHAFHSIYLFIILTNTYICLRSVRRTNCHPSVFFVFRFVREQHMHIISGYSWMNEQHMDGRYEHTKANKSEQKKNQKNRNEKKEENWKIFSTCVESCVSHRGFHSTGVIYSRYLCVYVCLPHVWRWRR